MTRGKCAIQAANRRARLAEEDCLRAKKELASQEATHMDELRALQAELDQTQRDMTKLAGEIAARDVARMAEQVESHKRTAASSIDLTRGAMEKMDRLILNACRYLSMTKGARPLSCLPYVIAWATDEDVYGLADDPARILVHLGVRPDGWTAATLRTLRRSREKCLQPDREAIGEPLAWRLDAADERPDDFALHPNYRTDWYPRVRDKTRLQEEFRDEVSA